MTQSRRRLAPHGYYELDTSAAFLQLLLTAAFVGGTGLGLVFFPTAYLVGGLFIVPCLTVFVAAMSFEADGWLAAVRGTRLSLRIGWTALPAVSVIALADGAGVLLVCICIAMTNRARVTARWLAEAGVRAAEDFDCS